MKKLFSAVALLIVLSACGQSGHRMVERPEFAARNTSTLEIDKVTVNDTATIVQIDAYFHPHYWIRIASDTYLRANGEKYMITGADGIELDAEHYMPDSGEDSFVLYFPPLPKGVKSFDFIESDCDDCFKIYGIDLTGNYTPRQSLPRDVRSVPATTELPAPELKIGKTTVKVHIHGEVDGYDPGEVTFIVFNYLNYEETEARKVSVENGVYTYEADQYGTTWGIVRLGNDLTYMILAPGETAEVHYDITAANAGSGRYSNLTRGQYVGFKGTYAAVNTEMNMPGNEFDINMYHLAMDPTVYLMDDAQYLQTVRRVHDEKVGELGEKEISDALRTLYGYEISIQDFAELVNKEMFFHNSEYVATRKRPTGNYSDYLTDADVEYLKTVYPGKGAMLAKNFASLLRPLCNPVFSDDQLDYICGEDADLWREFRSSLPAINQYESKEGASPEELEALDGVSDPFFRATYDHMRAQAIKARDEALAAGGFVIVDVPAVPAEDMLEAIIAEHKGKPVFVDFWATWCGPCLNAMKTIKPLKGEMADHGVVTIYISNTSSPETKWLAMLPDIGGIHYYMQREDWSALCQKYGIEGIPQYMIFDKEGNKTFQTAGFPGVENMKNELEKVW